MQQLKHRYVAAASQHLVARAVFAVLVKFLK